MSPDQLLLAVLGPVVLAGVAAAAWLAWLVHRDPGSPVTPDWDPAALDARPPTRPAGGHRAEHWHPHARAHELIATASADYEPRHGFDEVPPSLVLPLRLMDPAARARELVRQLGQAGWWPFADQTDRRLRIRLRAWAIAHRHGIPLLLGRLGPVGVLP